MKTYQLESELLPRSGDDHGNRTLKVYLAANARLIGDFARARGLWSHAQLVKDAWEITIDGTKAQFEEIREEFNARPLTGRHCASRSLSSQQPTNETDECPSQTSRAEHPRARP